MMFRGVGPPMGAEDLYRARWIFQARGYDLLVLFSPQHAKQAAAFSRFDAPGGDERSLLGSRVREKCKHERD